MNSAMSSPSSLLETLPGDSPLLQSIGKWGYIVSTYFPIIQMEIHLILSALFPIIIGAHASLKRPPSSAPPESDDDDREEDDELEGAVKEEFNAGLTPSDAIIFPITAGLTLGGLYFVIVWLKRADLVNVIMNGYLSSKQVFISEAMDSFQAASRSQVLVLSTDSIFHLRDHGNFSTASRGIIANYE
jgi:minor histocompatibility antigen H13